LIELVRPLFGEFMENNQGQEIDAFETIDFKRMFDTLRRGWLFIALGLLFGMGAAFLVSKLQTPIYAASTQVMIARSESQGPVTDITQSIDYYQISDTFVELLSQDWVREEVAQSVGGEIYGDQILVQAATNTQIIRIVAEDADPARAVVIANMLVQVLAEQNESIQSSRYNDTEASLDLQIADLEGKIADIQLELGEATAEALTEQISSAQNKIQVTEENIAASETELAGLKNVGNIARVQAFLTLAQNELEQYQLLLLQQLSDQQALQEKLTTDPEVQQDPTLASDITAQIAAMDVSINSTRQQIDSLTKEIAWLTPLLEPGAIERNLEAQEEYLASQRELLISYQDLYTKMLVSGKLDGPTDRMTSLEKNLSLYQQIYLNTLNNREAVRLARMQSITNVVQLNPAVATEFPVRPRVVLNTLLGGVAGLIFAIGFILLMNSLDTTLKTREDVERVLGLPVMGYSLHMEESNENQPGPYVVSFPRSPAAEAFRSLRTNLDFIAVDKPLKSVLVSSPGSSEGKTTVAVNLAAIIAQGGRRVVILDADLRRPRVHKALGLLNRTGLSDVFRDKISLTDAIQSWSDSGLSVITSGDIPPNPAELLASEKMRHILDELESLFDIVVVDSTPTIVADSQLIAARVGGVLLILSPGSTHAETARLTVEQYRRVGARLLGVVMNNLRTGQGQYGAYGPYSDYSYYQDSADESFSKNPKPGFVKFRFPWRRIQKAAPSDTGRKSKK
jgi:polysaccharide biosynthesis transport protein